MYFVRESEQKEVNVANSRGGLTLVEIVLVVGIIGLLAVFIIPAVNRAVRNRENVQAARKLQTAVEAFELCAAESTTNAYPAESSQGVVPTVMADYYFPYFKIDWWSAPTELGGNWDWDVDRDGFHLSVSIVAPTRSQTQMQEFDRLIDDGDLTTGRFQQVGTRYHYIIED